MTLQIGDTVGTYRIVARIGSGGIGEVFQVEHLVTKRVEALKILTGEAASTPERTQRFLREIQLQAGLSHPNIAAVHNAFRENGHLVMIMELIQGRSLRSLLETGRLPLCQSLDYASQALTALEFAHGHGVVHRDVSPSNMIVTQDGTLKLTDFGLAKSVSDLRLTLTGTLIGSLYYTSPEQVRGSTEPDARSDIYSMGAVLYEMATGVKPFSSDNPFTLMLAHVEETPRRPSDVDRSVPRALDEVLMTALEKDPQKRFQTAELLRRALEDASHEMGLSGFTNSETGACWAAPAPKVERRARASTATHASSGWQKSYWLVSAAVVTALMFIFAIRSMHLPAFKAPQERALGSELAALPFYWPADLLPVAELRYHPHRPRQQTTAQPAATEASHQPARKHNVFLRAFSRVARPLHHDSQPETTASNR